MTYSKNFAGKLDKPFPNDILKFSKIIFLKASALYPSGKRTAVKTLEKSLSSKHRTSKPQA